jgi:hypothetical protein
MHTWLRDRGIHIVWAWCRRAVMNSLTGAGGLALS